MGFCLTCYYPDHPQPPVLGGGGALAGLLLQQSQVDRSDNRQDNRLQGGGGRLFRGHTEGHTLSLQTPVQKVNFSICTERRDPPKLYEKDMEKQQLNSRQPRRLQTLMLEFLWLRVMRLPLQRRQLRKSEQEGRDVSTRQYIMCCSPGCPTG